MTLVVEIEILQHIFYFSMKLEIRFEMRQFKDFMGAIFISDIFAENTGCNISIV